MWRHPRWACHGRSIPSAAAPVPTPALCGARPTVQVPASGPPAQLEAVMHLVLVLSMLVPVAPSWGGRWRRCCGAIAHHRAAEESATRPAGLAGLTLLRRRVLPPVPTTRLSSHREPAPAPAAAPAPAPVVRTGPSPSPAPATAPARAAAVRSEPAPAPAPAPDPWAARPVPPVSTDAKRAWGPLTEGLRIPRDLDLADRARALDQLGISTGAHRLLVSRVNGALPERDAVLLVSSRPWPLLAHRMHTMAQAGEPFTAHLARLAPDTAAWRTGPPADTAKRLLLAAHHALTTPLDAPLPAGPRVSASAARSRSTTTGPDTTVRQQPAPAEPAPRAHHRAPAPRQGRGR